MKRKILTLIILTFLGWMSLSQKAIGSNNKFGVHILDPIELKKASELANGNGGEWGYVTVPVRANDRNLRKWQEFMDQAAELKIIPILRIAGEPENNVWRKPSFDEVIDFSNFLNDLSWPTKKKLIVVFNEPNHASEWGGRVDPGEYGAVLEFAIDRFKRLDPDFVIIPAGLDLAVPNSRSSMAAFDFWRKVLEARPDLGPKIEAISSHSYPNPAFSGSPSDSHRMSIAGFRHEISFLKRFLKKDVPVYITETGWRMDSISQKDVAENYRQAFQTVWADQRVMAVTPFLLFAGSGEFKKFSLLNSDSTMTVAANVIANMPKEKGEVVLPQKFGEVNVVQPEEQDKDGEFEKKLTRFLARFRSQKKLARLRVGKAYFEVDVARSESERAKGLSDRQTLESGTGMLFVFVLPDNYSFWMRGMEFPLDFVWISGGRVVEISTGIPAPKEGESPMSITPVREVEWVLEINSGEVERNDIKPGDIVELI